MIHIPNAVKNTNFCIFMYCTNVVIHETRLKSTKSYFVSREKNTSEDLMEIRKNPEKIRKLDKFPENKIIKSYMNSKPFILSRNMFKTA